MTRSRRSRRGFGRRALVWVIGGGIALLGWYRWSGGEDGVSHPANAFFEVKRRDLLVSVTEEGSLRALNETVIRSGLEGMNRIIHLAQEGVQVKKGELLVELDSSVLRDRLNELEISEQEKLLQLMQAEGNLAIQNSLAESNVREAEVQLENAQADLEKFRDGDAPFLIQTVEKRSSVLAEQVRIARERLNRTEELFKGGNATRSEVEADALSLKREQLALSQYQEDLRLIRQFDHPNQLRLLESNVLLAKKELERTKQVASNEIAQAEADVRTSERAVGTLEEAIATEKRRIQNAKIFAPQDGLVVYASVNPFGGGMGGGFEGRGGETRSRGRRGMGGGAGGAGGGEFRGGGQRGGRGGGDASLSRTGSGSGGSTLAGGGAATGTGVGGTAVTGGNSASGAGGAGGASGGAAGAGSSAGGGGGSGRGTSLGGGDGGRSSSASFATYPSMRASSTLGSSGGGGGGSGSGAAGSGGVSGGGGAGGALSGGASSGGLSSSSGSGQSALASISGFRSASSMTAGLMDSGSGASVIQEGQMVRQRQEIIRLPDVSRMIADIRVAEARVQQVEEGMPAWVEIQNLPGRRFRGSVRKIAPLPDSQMSWLNPNNKVYPTDILVEDSIPDLKPGISVRAQIVITNITAALAVPIHTVTRHRGESVCFVKRGREVVPVVVTTGWFNDHFMEVTSGLKEGDLVLLAPVAEEVTQQDAGDSPRRSEGEVGDKAEEKPREAVVNPPGGGRGLEANEAAPGNSGAVRSNRPESSTRNAGNEEGGERPRRNRERPSRPNNERTVSPE